MAIWLFNIIEIMLNNSAESEHPCLAPDPRGNVFSFPPLLIIFTVDLSFMAFIMLHMSGSHCKESASNAGDPGLIPCLGRSPGEGNGYPLHSSCWRIPWTEKPGGQQSI